MKGNEEEEEEQTTLVVRIIMEKAEEEQKGAGRPNAYWAMVRSQHDSDPDNFGGSFRGVRSAPHGGAATVRPNDTIGADDRCWCGEPLDHMWPGRTVGAKHPRKEAMKTMTAHVDRRDLRAYHRSVQDFLLHCINTNQLRFRISKNSVILYPPDGSTPMTVNARNSDRQMRQLTKWFVDHVAEEEPAQAEAEPIEKKIEQLAEVTNDPVEHPRRKPVEDVAVEQPEADTEAEPPVAPEEPAAEPAEEWRPYMRKEGGESPNIETNGTLYRCKWCLGTDHEFTTEMRRAIGGHNRVRHTDAEETLWSTAARAKAQESRREGRMKEAVAAAISDLQKAIGQPTSTDRVTDLEQQVADLTLQLAGANKRADDAEAKLALIREATSL